MFRMNKAGGGVRQSAPPPAQTIQPSRQNTPAAPASGPFTKGLVYRPSPEAIIREVTAQPQIPLPSEGTPPSAGPILYAIPILDGSSYEELRTFFKFRVVELDRASGTKLHIVDIGDWEQSGEFYKAMQAPGERDRGARDGRAFAKNVHATGRTDYVRLNAMNKLAAELGLTSGEMPCLIFLRPGKFAALEMLTFKLEWYASSSARSSFGRVLERWLDALKLDGVAPSGPMGDPLTRTISREIEVLTRSLDEQIHGDPAPDGSLGFERLGNGWRVRFEGTSAFVQHTVGMDHLRELIANPGREFEAWELQNAKSASPNPALAGEPVFDDRTRAEVEARMAELSVEIAAATKSGEIVKKQRLEEEKLARYLVAGTGLGGRPRLAKDDQERARKAVGDAIRRSITKIAAVHPALGKHLKQYVRRGIRPSYCPDRPMVWRTKSSQGSDTSPDAV